MSWKTLWACLLTLMLSVFTAAPVQAQTADGEPEVLRIERGHSLIFDRRRPVKQVILGDPAVIDVEGLSPQQFRVKGLELGTTNLLVIFADNPSRPLELRVVVQQDLSELLQRIDGIVAGGSAPSAYPVNGRLVLDGMVDSVQHLEQIAAVARLYDEDFVNLMSVGGDHQVQLEVLFAEISRSGLRQLGINALWGDSILGIGLQSPGSVATTTVVTASNEIGIGNQQGVGTVNAAGGGTFNIAGIFADPLNLSAVLSVLEESGVSQILAQPTLTALSGQQAEFLSGGEIPVPAAQNAGQVGITYKEYGIRLTFIPTVLGEQVIDVRVYFEVSDLDVSNSVRLTGIEIPAFVSRKSSSHLRIESGKTFAMAGLLSENSRSTVQRLPILGDIPVLGMLFRNVLHSRDESELMIFVTPKLVRPMAPEEVPLPPGKSINFNPTDIELFLFGAHSKVGSKTAEPTGPMGLER
ncbi:MAG: pilus assembly protein N-terminal domain-containing protein [Myxococcota bacterium]